MSKFINNIVDFFHSHWKIIAFFIYIINITFILSFDPFNIVKNYTKTIIFLIVSVGFFNLLLGIYFSRNDEEGKTLNTTSFIFKVFGIIFFLLIFFGLIFAFVYYILFTPFSLDLVVNLLNLLFLIGLLAIGYRLIKYFLNSKDTFSGNSKFILIINLILQVIFYIPCLLIDAIEYFKYQNKITSKTVWLLLLLEIIIIILRFSIPNLYKKFKHKNGNLIEKGPIYLNNETNLGVFQNLKYGIVKKNIEIGSPPNYNFCLSCWIWINPQPESTNSSYTSETSLLNYGDIFKINFNKNTIEILASTSTESKTLPNKLIKVYETKDFPYQKWNNFVINYFGGTLDVFLNNKLVMSQINITPILFPNKVTSGSKNGINGGIKNIVYYNKVLTRNQISNIYNNNF